jgi:hypothetical protein
MTTTLKDFLADPNNLHDQQGQLTTDVNRVYAAKGNVNCYLTPDEARRVAENLLTKARLIEDNGITDGAVLLWSVNADTLSFGLKEAVVGERRSVA